MKLRHQFYWILPLFSPNIAVNAQSVNVPLNQDYHHIIERYEIRSGKLSETFHTTFKPYMRSAVAAFADTVLQSGTELSEADRFNLNYLKDDNFEWVVEGQEDYAYAGSRYPILKKIYRKKGDMFYLDPKDLDFHASPVLYLSGGVSDGKNVYLNTRGAELRGMIARKIGFYTFVGETQARFPDYVDAFIQARDAVPNEGFYKRFKKTGYDFITARGYISFSAVENYINVQAGQDKVFVGDGYRTLAVSDFSNYQPFVRINSRIWRINYVNHFSQLTQATNRANIRYPRKFQAFHQLNLNLSKNFTLGFFENVIFGGTDSAGNTRFDISYLNPMIFYRFVEQQTGSADNALMGVNFKWNLFRRLQLYGTIMLDEFKLQEVRAGKGWWANKQAFQAGLKYIDAFGAKNLDLQGEINYVRPYMYTHFMSPYGMLNYTSFNQPLAHPLGANFIEVIGIVRVQPLPRLNLTGKLFVTETGLDTGNRNWGQDIFRTYEAREQTYYNVTGQGIRTYIGFADFTVSYQIRHNLFIDLKQVLRVQKATLSRLDDNTVYSSLSVRLNIAQRLHEF